jgi:arabinofuranosyltransferase
MFTQKRAYLIIPIVLILVVMGFIIQRAWVSDDAYISFRTIDNLVNGYRLTWNPAERVQAFTHPLWMIILTIFYFFTREIYLTSIVVSLLFTLASLILLVRSTQSVFSSALVLLVLGLSNAFIDYSTSGLENPAGHLLIILFCLVFLQNQKSGRHFFFLSLIVSLAAVNRSDSVLIFLPALLLAFIQTPQKMKSILWGLIGQLPLILWEIFSLFYYGFLFPNTAYAKLNTFIPAGESIQQGIYYLLNSIQHDPVTLSAVMLSLVAVLFVKNKKANLSLVLGAFIYILYVIQIGGDFMSGRFFTLPLMVSVFVLGQVTVAPSRRLVYALAGLWFFIAGLFLSPNPTYRMINPPSVPTIDSYGIADERLWYFSGMGLFRNNRFNPQPNHPWIREGQEARQKLAHQVVVREGIGLFGYYAGPQVYIIDVHALSDPLLARLPAKRWVNWQIGHFERVIPDGYIDTMKVDKPSVSDPQLKEFDQKLFIITRGDLFSWDRLVEIWKMNTGQYNHLINVDRYRFPNMLFLTLYQLKEEKTPGTTWNDPANQVFGDQGVEIDLQGKPLAKSLNLSLSANDNFQVIFLNSKNELASLTLPAGSKADNGLAIYTLDVPAKAVQGNCDRIRILPIRSRGIPSLDLIRGDGNYSIGHLILK